MKLWICTKCALVIPSNTVPRNSSCQKGGTHQWTLLTYDGDVVPRPGLKAWQCRHCGTLVYSKNTPNQAVRCPAASVHLWIQITQ